MTTEQIVNIKEYIDSYDWENVTAQSLTDVIEEAVVKYCDLKSKKKLNKEGKKFKSKNRIPRMVRLNMRRKQEASKAIKTVKSAERCRKLKNKIAAAEKEISKSYFGYKINKENDALDKMKTNKKFFFTYVKNKQSEKGKI